MAIEVELKAWVDDPAALERVLSERYRKERSFRKEDAYYRAPKIGDGHATEFRLRGEGDSWVVTFKEKRRSGGVERNLEREFAISDPEAFRVLAMKIGCLVFVRKVKGGTLFSKGDVSIELTNVEGLGNFVEIEKLVEGGDDAVLNEAEREIRGILHEIGIDDSMIEERYYTEMLLSNECERKT